MCGGSRHGESGIRRLFPTIGGYDRAYLLALEAGSTLGHYEIVSSLGAGGMGEVYRAKDTKLGREVAIKLLLDEVSADPERLARFEREARVLASLNHNNIATLHGFEKEGDTSFLVMELVEGETLADRIKRGAIPVDEALPLFIQIAEGLEAAHEKGVIHRDLKPANIKVTANGQVKILDFGLAKAMAPEVDTGDPAMSQSPTLTLAATQRGEILGTAAYMSPEQASGEPTDKRTDIWAFGACLFEALSGRRTFGGDKMSIVLASVLKDEPDFALLDPTTPRAARRVLRSCLEKDPALRLHDIADGRLELERADEEEELPAIAISAKRGVGGYLGAALLGALAAGAAVWWAATPEPAQPLRPQRFSISLPGRGMAGSDSNRTLRVSPDGQSVVFFTSLDLGTGHPLMIRQASELEPRPVAGTEAGYAPFFSPDASWLGFKRLGSLVKVRVTGGSAQVLYTGLRGFSGDAAWGPDGYIYFINRVADDSLALFRVSDDGGEPERLYPTDGGQFEGASGDVALLPHMRAVLVGIENPFGGRAAGTRIEALDLATGQRHVLVQGATLPAYADSGHLVYVEGGRVWAVPFDAERLELTGPPHEITEPAMGITQDSDFVSWDLARGGTLVYAPAAGSARVVHVDETGSSRPLDTPPPDLFGLASSPDGRLLALTSGKDIWVHDRARATATRITFESGFYPVWTPDGDRIVFASGVAGSEAQGGTGWDLWWQKSDGSKAAERRRLQPRAGWLHSGRSDSRLLRMGVTGHL